MSSYYYKVVPPPKPPVMIGTKKVGHVEMAVIVNRLYRSNSAGRYKQTPEQMTLSPQLNQTSSAKKRLYFDLDKFLLRIQRPTISQQLSRQSQVVADVDDLQMNAQRKLDLSELGKVLAQLTRPTTASRGKRAVKSHPCEDNDGELSGRHAPIDYPRSSVFDKAVSLEKAQVIVARVSSATKSSDRDRANPCCRLEPDYEAIRTLSKGLPLISGLRPSKSVSEVVNRLYGGYSCKPTNTSARYVNHH